MSELIYDALMLGRNKSVAREEYLSFVGEKTPVSIEAKEKSIRFSDIMSDTTGIVHLKVTHEGYAEIEVFSEDAFISFDRNVISTDEFKDGCFDFSFTILAEKIHNGKNFARITFRNPVFDINIDIVVDNSVRVGFAEKSGKEKMAALTRSYIDLRLGNLFQTEWQNKTLAIMGEVGGGNVTDMFLMLYKANVLITQDKNEEAGNLLEFVGEQIAKLSIGEWELVSYYYYIISLYEMDDEITAQMLSRVKTIYELHPSWRILWILIYMDGELNNSPKDMIERMEEEFLLRKMNSPVMYYEAVECFKKEPKLITEPDKFVIQTLNFAVKEDFLSIEIGSRFAEIIWQADEKKLANANMEAVLRILKGAYDRYETNLILKSLCRAIIFAGKKDCCYHKYIEKAINEFLETKDIYNYFIYTADKEHFVRLPDAVMEFFVGREIELGSERYYYFACLIKEKQANKDYYEKALPNIIRAARDAIVHGLTGRSLAVIYRDLMDSEKLPLECYQRMLEILCMRMITCENKLAVSVLVFQKEFNEYQEAVLKDGKAFVRIYSKDAVILFKDTTGNLYSQIDYAAHRFLPKMEYLDLCIRYSPVTRYMLIGDNLTALKALKDPSSVLDWLYSHIGKGELRKSYEQELLKALIAQLSKNNPDKHTTQMLFDFLETDLEDSTRAALTELMIERHMYREAYEEIEKNGFACVSDERIAQLVHVLAEITDYEEDDVMEQLACQAFLNTDYDGVIFRYMVKRYNKKLDVLILMYVQAKAHGDDTGVLSERIIRKMTEIGEYPIEAESIFAGYFAEGSDIELKKSFMSGVAENFLYKKSSQSEYIFKYIERGIAAKEEFEPQVIIAYLIYMKDREALERKSLRIIEERINDLVRKGIMLEEFKEFGKYFKLPPVLCNTYIAEKIENVRKENETENLTKKSMFQSAPVITFELKQRDRVVSKKEAMKEAAPGCFVCNFTLFYGESLTYSIDGGEKKHVDYHDLDITHDESRFADLDDMIKVLGTAGEEKLRTSVIEYYKKTALMDKLF